MTDYQASDAISPLGASSSQGAPAVPVTLGDDSVRKVPPTSPSAGSGEATVKDSVVISQAALAAAGQQPPPAASAPAPFRQSGPPPKPPMGLDAASQALRFSYNPETQTLQAQVVDPNTGKTVVEMPSDDQIRVQEKVRKLFAKAAKPKSADGE